MSSSSKSCRVPRASLQPAPGAMSTLCSTALPSSLREHMRALSAINPSSPDISTCVLKTHGWMAANSEEVGPRPLRPKRSCSCDHRETGPFYNAERIHIVLGAAYLTRSNSEAAERLLS